MNETFKKILSVCCTVVTTLTATLFRSTEVHAENTYKIVFIGDEKVGKTQIMNRIKGDPFSDNYKSTMGLDQAIVQTGNNSSLEFLEASGNVKFRELQKENCENAKLTILCCDINSQPPTLKEFPGSTSETDILLCITKIDQATQDVPRNTDTNLQQEISNKLLEFKHANGEYENILSQVLVTSARNNEYQICKPEKYDSNNYKNIDTALARDIGVLCGDSKNNDQLVAVGTTPLDESKDSNRDGNDKSRIGYWLGIPTMIFGLGSVVVFGYYEYDKYKQKEAVNHPTGKHIQHENKKIKRLLNN